MKKIFIVVALIVISSLTACNSKDNVTSNNGQSVESKAFSDTESNNKNQDKNVNESGISEGETSDHVGKPGEKK